MAALPVVALGKIFSSDSAHTAVDAEPVRAGA